MLIKDPNGKYELKVDKTRRIVYEKLVGAWDEETFKNYDDDYRKKIITLLGAGKWIKCSDMRGYKPNTKVTPEMMNNHLAYANSKGCNGGAVLVDSATLKMQINRAGKSTVEVGYFDNEADADTWLKSQGY